MTTTKTAMLAELPEHLATGRLAEIYAEIRVFSGVPYVSSLQRYLATMPGVLEWAWDAVRPALVSGVIPETGWRLARMVHIPPAAPISPGMVRQWGLNTADLAAIRNVAQNFVRVSPVNLMTGACLNRLLTGSLPSGEGFHDLWTPPAMLAAMPGNVDPLTLADEERDVLMRFATTVDGAPFLPALYRQLAHWPSVMAWLARELGPRLAAPETANARLAFRTAARDAAPEIVARLPGPITGPAPDAEIARRILATIDRYAETSPEMTMFGQLILDALPPPDAL